MKPLQNYGRSNIKLAIAPSLITFLSNKWKESVRNSQAYSSFSTIVSNHRNRLMHYMPEFQGLDETHGQSHERNRLKAGHINAEIKETFMLEVRNGFNLHLPITSKPYTTN